MLFFKILASIYLLKVPISHQKEKKSDQGFTLLELLISGIIVGILSAIATPAYIATIDKFHYGEAKLQMGCIKRELEAFRFEKGYFPEDVNRDTVPAGIDCFVKSNTTLTPYNSTYDYENWSTNGGCVVKIAFLGKDREKQSANTRNLHQQSGFYDDRERDRNSDDLILSLGWQPPEVCG
ncbi:putative general secretion pathway protein G [Crocosphaera subtropica ATCC 51142]|uniref:General secretion pathway protein G n=1 Tax=Crocosphaera subtropica (strain ATCC 51142 / BH68) TaxID=43989 RepID=B1WU29_CROS5|nr:prepilin-type N-terminal cleavage/methylation domain-containing protein [Crocosphaera subtropica]ACB52091.1 putative general secretion pathway protein G [Crocosphaera subtropica ATCC 51142]